MTKRCPQGGGSAVRALALAAAALPLLAGCADDFPELTYAERYCYRTLAEVDCHSRPLPGEENRRVGFYDTPVAVEDAPVAAGDAPVAVE
ncbi:MAG TPA: hypothetical protein VIR45_04290 [Kiloniellaceae bacterium]